MVEKIERSMLSFKDFVGLVSFFEFVSFFFVGNRNIRKRIEIRKILFQNFVSGVE